MKRVKALLPLSEAPKDRPVMLVCQGDIHHEAEWISCRHEGELLWEGWAYMDPILRDVCPEGPTRPLSWYEKPTQNWEPEPVPRSSQKSVRENRPASQDEWHEWASLPTPLDAGTTSSHFEFFPGTPAQAVMISRMMREGPVRIIRLDPIRHARLPTVSIAQFTTADEHCDVSFEVETVLCPVILDRFGDQFLVLPNGEFRHLDSAFPKDDFANLYEPRFR